MRRQLSILIAALFCSAVLVYASPASPVPYPYTQPDGSVIMLVNHGDEFNSWITWNGTVVEKGPDGYYRPVANARAKMLKQRMAGESARQNAARLQAEARAKGISIGAKRFLVLLVDFPDRLFTTADAGRTFSRMLNEAHYSDGGATGSVRDFLTDNSSGLFNPTFDVYGPVTLDKSYSYYGKDSGADRNSHVHDALYEACLKLKDQIDFSVYDNDKDGYVDNIFFYFAGHSQSDGADEDSFWSHASVLSSYNLFLNGTRIYGYSCASEYRGASGTNRTGIASFCHEFGHSLGLPDFYDTDYETNGTAFDLSCFSIMNSGAMNNTHTPVNYTSIERQMLGWLDGFRQITGPGSYTLGSLSDNSAPYVIPADVDGEFFLVEMRDGTGWDAYLPKGVIVYHVDKSQNFVASGITARQTWDGNAINRYSNHPCCFLELPGGYSSNDLERMVYPGAENVTTFTPLAWSGNHLPIHLTGISISGSRAEFRVETFSDKRQLVGQVTGTDAAPIAGVVIAIESEAGTSSARMQARPNQVSPRSAAYTARTDADGRFVLTIPESESSKQFMVSAYKDGYITRSSEVTVDRFREQNFVLRKLDDAMTADLCKFPSGGSAYGVGYVYKPQDLIAAVHYSTGELQQWGGMYLQTVSFQYTEDKPYSGEAYVLVEQGSKRVLYKKVENAAPYTTLSVDVSEDRIQIDPDKDMYIGYALRGVNAEYPLIVKRVGEECGGFYISWFSATRTNWTKCEKQAVMVSATLMDTDGQKNATLSSMGYSTIVNPGGYQAGSEFTFALDQSLWNPPESVAWFYDGLPCPEASVTLTSGHHRIRAVLNYSSGETETLVLEIDVP